MSSRHSIPAPTLARLAGYLRCLTEIEPHELEFVSSEELGRRAHCPAELVRRDLSYFGEFGRRGVGYNVALLRQTVADILRLDRPQSVVLLGAGNLGRALIAYPGWSGYNLQIVAAFDTDPAKIGTHLWGVEVLDAECVGIKIPEFRARLAIMAVPSAAAQAAADRVAAAGIRGILNFAPVPLTSPPGVEVRNVSFITEIAVLSYQAAVHEEGGVP